jgi:hypothetical protein
MTAARAKREPSMASAIAAIVKAGLCPRIERRPDGTMIVTGIPPAAERDFEAEFIGWQIEFSTKRGIRDETQAAIIEAQREIITSMLWMLYGPVHIKARPPR